MNHSGCVSLNVVSHSKGLSVGGTDGAAVGTAIALAVDTTGHPRPVAVTVLLLTLGLPALTGVPGLVEALLGLVGGADGWAGVFLLVPAVVAGALVRTEPPQRVALTVGFETLGFLAVAACP
jgi:hypothetical protein